MGGMYDDVVGNRAYLSKGDRDQIIDMYNCGCRVSVVAGANGFDLTDPKDPIAIERKAAADQPKPADPGSLDNSLRFLRLAPSRRRRASSTMFKHVQVVQACTSPTADFSQSNLAGTQA